MLAPLNGKMSVLVLCLRRDLRFSGCLGNEQLQTYLVWSGGMLPQYNTNRTFKFLFFATAVNLESPYISLYKFFVK